MGKGSAYPYRHFMLFDADMHDTTQGDFEVELSFDREMNQAEKTAVHFAVTQAVGRQIPPPMIENLKDGTEFQYDLDTQDDVDKVKDYAERQGIAFEVLEEPESVHDEEALQIFKKDVREAFRTTDDDERYIENNVLIIGATDTLEIGIDRSGGHPCIFARPKSYEDGEDTIPYTIDGAVKQAFNRLIREYTPGTFSKATTAWTSEELTEY